jgi:hypothetical protein
LPKLSEPTGRNTPAAEVCCVISQRNVRIPAAMKVGAPTATPVTMSACGRRALS